MRLLDVKNWAQLGATEKAAALHRPQESRSAEVTSTVAQILRDVRETGDAALLSYTRKFDSEKIVDLRTPEAEIEAARAQVSPQIVESLKEASRRIRIFHEAQKPKNLQVETSVGVVCEKRYIPIDRVGLYIPGGTAPLPSTLMMLAIPALVAGCPEITLVTPPDREGRINPVILAAAGLLGVKRIYKCGGAQAIAALAFGTHTIGKVDKIFGPGNAWVTEAKIQVALDPAGAAIDMPAGPSEVLVIADESANPVFVASDLLSQAEHDRNSQVLLISTSVAMIEKVQVELARQLATLPRKEIAAVALNSSRALVARDLLEAIEISNRYAPEHLILQVNEPRSLALKVRNAGSVFLGPWTPESVGDYASGTNHVLPTYGFARAFSGLSLESFMKSVSFQELSEQGLRELGPVVEILAAAEGLEAHRRAVSLRLENMTEKMTASLK